MSSSLAAAAAPSFSSPCSSAEEYVTPPDENETFHLQDFFSPSSSSLAAGGAAGAAAGAPTGRGVSVIPLRSWVRGEEEQMTSKQSIVRKTTIAYAIAELLVHHSDRHRADVDAATASRIRAHRPAATEAVCRIDNFAVRVRDGSATAIEGVDMISPRSSLTIVSPYFLSDDFFYGETDDGTRHQIGDTNSKNGDIGPQERRGLGRYLEVEIQDDKATAPSDGRGEAAASSRRRFDSSFEGEAACHSFGALLHELFSGSHPFDLEVEAHRDCSDATRDDPRGDAEEEEPSRKKKTFSYPLSLEREDSNSPLSVLRDSCWGNNDAVVPNVVVAVVGPPPPPTIKYVPLKEFGIPSSVSSLVKDLLECGIWGDLHEFRPDDALPTLGAARDDLHLLLRDPDRFLFDRVARKSDAGAAVVVGLDVERNRLYGRDEERSLISDVFCQVSLTGESEVIFIEGFSGSGKSRLAESVFPYVEVNGGYVIRQKFNQISQEKPVSVVIAALNDLCPMIREKSSRQELDAIVLELKALFGSHLSTLARVLPNISRLSPDLNLLASSSSSSSHEQRHAQQTEINLNRVYFILQLFMRVVSSKTHPVMLFLDDIQWADATSLLILKHILDDIKGSSCVFFVGSYRNNEVPNDHAVFGFMKDLAESGVRSNSIRLDGLEIDDVNRMTSDALGILPRVCRPLSQLVLRKTKGNPLFVLECLRSLVDRRLLRYSHRARSWVWDIDVIGAEDIADNVCELLSVKMIGLSENTQLALKTASCFGIAVDSTVVDTLVSASVEFSSLRVELEKVVDDGFMNKDDTGSTYRFTHDKVREAAYGLIEDAKKHQFHHVLGMLLYQATMGQNIDSMIFLIVDQINHGDILEPNLRVNIAALNHQAASRAMRNSNFAAAYFYSSAAMKLIPRDHWESHYDLSRSIFLVRGNAAIVDGRTNEATSALDEILFHGKTLNDKLDAYYLKISLLSNCKESKLAYDMSVEVLEVLGETIPADVDSRKFVYAAQNIHSELSMMTEKELMDMKTMEKPLHVSLMKFYNQACHISYFANPSMLKWHACRLVELCFEHGMNKYAALGILRFAMVLGGSLIQDEEGGYRIGKMALKLIERFDATDLLPTAYEAYYAYIAVHVEPYQSCADMLKRGFEIGLSNGDINTTVGANYIQKSLLSGRNLPALKKECDYQLRLIVAQSRPMHMMYMSALQETISMLISNAGSSGLSRSDDVSRVKEFSGALVFHGVLQHFWLGHYDRCFYYAEKSSLSDFGQLKSIQILFYGGISCFHGRKKFKSNKNLVGFAKRAIEVISKKGEIGSWNYKNKVHLLEAEMMSATRKVKDHAKAKFTTAIQEAKASKFVHEQGLACELAALHCLKHGDLDDASTLLQQALECYIEWGSQAKINSIKNQLENICS